MPKLRGLAYSNSVSQVGVTRLLVVLAVAATLILMFRLGYMWMMRTCVWLHNLHLQERLEKHSNKKRKEASIYKTTRATKNPFPPTPTRAIMMNESTWR